MNKKTYLGAVFYYKSKRKKLHYSLKPPLSQGISGFSVKVVHIHA